mmetsp:Transcript_11699/g.13383  ORF Transcript_11699/g.13383 Transcript_11699/m.13383 type:complete len:412 (+) Transcript_11699:57-1292(+)|eukprot:CAMPEP_0170920926 /NCGR_PEP_ID=MMETSP0735-20130129/9523_1 /TAXON_ID=186038 /ORGANISM="Fragilariopsis kerguelensis, Strain L26-C5" /LENGTH=411 /DNA_ID=CAMNT_0011319997 /DNA_START=52 /DNA_END=1287 /DNA_ORIENTATION=-
MTLLIRMFSSLSLSLLVLLLWDNIGNHGSRCGGVSSVFAFSVGKLTTTRSSRTTSISSSFVTTLRSSSIDDNGAASASALQPGDTIAVIGASGNVGKLVALRLSDTYNVHGIVRDASSSSLREFFKGRLVDDGEDQTKGTGSTGSIQLFEADLLEELERQQKKDNLNKFGSGSGASGYNKSCPKSLLAPLKTANAIVICTGTTAFPTEAWSRNGDKDVTSEVLKSLWETKLNVQDTLTQLDALGLNTPNNIDSKGNRLLIDAWDYAAKVPQKRAILLSSIGVQRRTAMPFPILNACGVLDAKADAEAYLTEQAKNNDYTYTILRPGQLFGGPYDNNYYLGTIFELDKDSDTQELEMQVGDTLLGDTLRSSVAEITAQLCDTNTALNLDFAVVNVKGSAPSVSQIQTKLQQL